MHVEMGGDAHPRSVLQSCNFPTRDVSFESRKIPMDTAQIRIKNLFIKIVRICNKLADDPSADRVHQFRTTMRRIESLLNASEFRLTAKDRKVLAQLEEIRKRAGKVRDIDVQLTALKSIGLDRTYEQ